MGLEALYQQLHRCRALLEGHECAKYCHRCGHAHPSNARRVAPSGVKEPETGSVWHLLNG